VLPIQCDVQDADQVDTAVSACHNTLGPIDIMIANAGIGMSAPGYKPLNQSFEQCLKTNVLGAVYAFNAVIPSMIERRSGQLVSISSLASYRGLPEAGPYSASKAALSTLTESLRLDLKKYKISVSLINPGYIVSPMTDRNDYMMPFIMSTETGVRKIVKAIRKKKAIYAFPFPLSILVKSLRFWPIWLYDLCFSGRKNKKRS
jgi:Short-chain dehydrogenases of various substrate specificities